MRNDYTDITVLLDRSGSMTTIRSDMEGGFNEFIEKQKNVDGLCLVSLYQFDDNYDVVYQNTNIKNVPKLDLQPRGYTALLDAMARTIDNTGKRLRDMNESDRPSKVLFLVLTDGYENASKEVDLITVKRMVEHQKDKYSWEFIFIGAGIDAINTATSFGISAGKALNAVANSSGTHCMWNSTNKHITRYRNMNQEEYCVAVTNDTLFDDEDKDWQRKAADENNIS